MRSAPTSTGDCSPPAATSGNLLLSPLSIELALAMTRTGAAGETRAQMDAVLLAGAGDELDRSLNALDQALATRSGHKGDRGAQRRRRAARRQLALGPARASRSSSRS